MDKKIFGYEEEFIAETTLNYCQLNHIKAPANDQIGSDFWQDVQDGSKMLLSDEEIFKLI